MSPSNFDKRTSRVTHNLRLKRRLETLHARCDTVISRIAVLRLIAFVSTILCVLAMVNDRVYQPWLPASVVGAVLFVIAVVLHRKPYRLLPRIALRIQTVDECVARLEHRWDALEDDGQRYVDSDRPELEELQVFGPVSLFKLLNRAGLPWSKDRLAKSLKDGCSVGEIEEMQAAAREAQSRSVLRNRVEVEARLAQISNADVEAMLRWAESTEHPLSWLKLAARAAYFLVPLTTTLVVLRLTTGVVTLWEIPFLIQLFLFLGSASRLGPHYQHLIGNPKERPLVALRTVFERVERARFESARLKSIAAPWRDSAAVKPSERLKRFEKIVDALAVRHGAMLYSILAIGLLWELVQCQKLESWRQEYGRTLRVDLEALSQFETCFSLAGFAADTHGLCWPTVHAPRSERPFVAESLGHPLLHPDKRKANDFQMADTGTMLLVTGSNMSGKSTFLRTVGANLKLALAGAPVCADSADMIEVDLVTSIQVTDSPEEGLSRFYAEVKRLAKVVHRVEAAEDDTQRPCMYLVDEMLSGTNSRERRLACRHIMGRLVDVRRSYGLVTTHDLALVKAEQELPGQVVCAHFADRFDGDQMHFDYVMKPGVSTTTNALHVLRLEGIDVVDPEHTV